MELPAGIEQHASLDLHNTLLRWAKHLSPDEKYQTDLVKRTITAATMDSDGMLDGPVDKALCKVMQDLFLADVAKPKSAGKSAQDN